MRIGRFHQRANFLHEPETKAVDAHFGLFVIVPAMMEQLTREGAYCIDQGIGAIRVETVVKAQQEIVFVDQHMGRMDPSHIQRDEMIDQGSIARDVDPVARVMIFDQTSAIVFDGLAQLGLGRRGEILRAGGHGAAQPFDDRSMALAAFQPLNNLRPLVVIFQSADDLFDPVIFGSQAIVLLVQRLVLPLEAVDLANHVLLGRLEMDLIVTAVGQVADDTPPAGWPRSIALEEHLSVPWPRKGRTDPAIEGGL